MTIGSTNIQLRFSGEHSALGNKKQEIRGTPYLIIVNAQRIWFIGSMPRSARVVAPGFPHHITQRENRRQRTFFNYGCAYCQDYYSQIKIVCHYFLLKPFPCYFVDQIPFTFAYSYYTNSEYRVLYLVNKSIPCTP